MEWSDKLAASKKRYEEQKSRGSTPGPAPSAPPPSSRPGPRPDPPSTPPEHVVYRNNNAALAKAMEESLNLAKEQANIEAAIAASLATAGTKRPVENSALAVAAPANVVAAPANVVAAPANAVAAPANAVAAPANAVAARPGKNNALAVPIEGFCPLQNVGNSCYMNASMQVLYSIAELRQFFLNLTDGEIETSCIMKDCQLEKDEVQRFMKLMQIFFTKMQETAESGGTLVITNVTDDTIDTNLYKDLLKVLGSRFQPREQVDAGEFITRVMNMLFCSDLLKPIAKKFKLIETSQITCEDERLNPLPPKKEEAFSLEIPITDRNVTSIESGLAKLQEVEPMGSPENQLEICAPEKYVEKNNGTFLRNEEGKLKDKKGLATSKQITINLVREKQVVSSKYAFITIRRSFFDLTTMTNIKLHKRITPSKTIQIEGQTFKLRNAICQLGGDEGGHYISYSFNDRGTPILEFNDDQILPFKHSDTYFSKWKPGGPYEPPQGDPAPAEAGKLIEQTATILLYERIPEALNAGPLPYGPSETNFVPQAPTWDFNTSLVNTLKREGYSANAIASLLEKNPKNIQAYLQSRKGKGTRGGRRKTRKSKKSKKRATRKR